MFVFVCCVWICLCAQSSRVVPCATCYNYSLRTRSECGINNTRVYGDNDFVFVYANSMLRKALEHMCIEIHRNRIVFINRCMVLGCGDIQYCSVSTQTAQHKCYEKTEYLMRKISRQYGNKERQRYGNTMHSHEKNRVQLFCIHWKINHVKAKN